MVEFQDRPIENVSLTKTLITNGKRKVQYEKNELQYKMRLIELADPTSNENEKLKKLNEDKENDVQVQGQG